MVLVAIAPSLIWGPRKRADQRTPGPDTTQAARTDSTPVAAAVPPSQPERPALPPSERTAPAAAPAETVWVTSNLYRLGFSTQGGELVRAELLRYKSFAPR